MPLLSLYPCPYWEVITILVLVLVVVVVGVKRAALIIK